MNLIMAAVALANLKALEVTSQVVCGAGVHHPRGRMVVVGGGRCRVRRAGVVGAVALVEKVATASSFMPPILAYLALRAPATAVAAIAASSTTAVVSAGVLATPLAALLLPALAAVVLAAMALSWLRVAPVRVATLRVA